MTARISNDEKVRENRLRRAAERQGLRLQKARRRDPRAWDYGRWYVVDSDGVCVSTGQPFDLDQVERFLLGFDALDDLEAAARAAVGRPTIVDVRKRVVRAARAKKELPPEPTHAERQAWAAERRAVEERSRAAISASEQDLIRAMSRRADQADTR
jgi:hypothetical protein